MKIDAPKESALLTAFCKVNGESLDEKGIYPCMAMFRHSDETQTCASMAMTGPTVGPDTMKAIRKIMSEGRPVVECAFGIDRNFKAGQGLMHEGCDFLTIFYWDGEDFRYGLMQYDFPTKTIHPIQWGNPFWCERMDYEQACFSLRANLKRMAELAAQSFSA